MGKVDGIPSRGARPLGELTLCLPLPRITLLMNLMKTLALSLLSLSLLGLSSCGECNCNKYNPEVLKGYKPTPAKQFQ